MSLGIFSIEGKSLDNFDKDFIINITLFSGQNALYNLPKSPKEVKLNVF